MTDYDLGKGNVEPARTEGKVWVVTGHGSGYWKDKELEPTPDYTEADYARALTFFRGVAGAPELAALIARVRDEGNAEGYRRQCIKVADAREQGRREGRRAGLEEAAVYHDNEAAGYEMAAKQQREQGNDSAATGFQWTSSDRRDAATFLRALAAKPELSECNDSTVADKPASGAPAPEPPEGGQDSVAINGPLRVEVTGSTICFYSQFDGWVANVGDTEKGDGLTVAEAKRMAELWNAATAKLAPAEEVGDE